MKKLFVLLSLGLIYFFFLPSYAHAIEDPLASPNNKFGIHILFQEELRDGAKLVNSNGGDWGYITIPIQAGDKNIVKWQQFMDDCRKYHVIPIIRLASEGDYFNTKVWRKPNAYDVLDFSNFLNSLDWPTKNRYVVVFNEPNRGDEWGGTPDPADYAQLLSYAVSAFKSLNDNFFIITGGLDNASATIPGESYNDFDYLRLMNESVPGIFQQVDGLSSHSYPNPAFSKPANKLDNESIATFQYENAFIQSLGGKKLPVFITETGWTKQIGEQRLSDYYRQAVNSTWADDSIVAITPFLLNAGAGPFEQFSFLRTDGSKTNQYIVYESFEKQKGAPKLYQKVLGETTNIILPEQTKKFNENERMVKKLSGVGNAFKTMASWILKF